MTGVFRRRFRSARRPVFVAGKAAAVTNTATVSLEALAQRQGLLATTSLTAAGQASFARGDARGSGTGALHGDGQR